MSLIRRIDHPIICVSSLAASVPEFDEVLDLRSEREREGDEWGFSNAELPIGDGFLGVVEPSGEDSQLHRFLASKGEGFYALAVDVGDLDAVAAKLDDRGVRYRDALRDGQRSLLWVPHTETHGVLYQLTSGVAASQGTNPHYMGVSEVVIAVRDADEAIDTYGKVFGFKDTTNVDVPELGYRGARLGAALGDGLVLAEPSDPSGALAEHLDRDGESMFQFTIAVRDMAAERVRLAAAEVATTTSRDGDRTWIDPAALGGLRIELGLALQTA